MICRDCTGIYDAQGEAAHRERPPCSSSSRRGTIPTWNLNALNPIIRRYTQGIGDFTFSVDRHVSAGWIGTTGRFRRT